MNDHAGVIYAWQKCIIESYGSVFDGNYARGMGGVMFVEEDTTVVNYQVLREWSLFTAGGGGGIPKIARTQNVPPLDNRAPRLH